MGEIASRFGEPKEGRIPGVRVGNRLSARGNGEHGRRFHVDSQLFNLVSQAPSNVNVSDLTGAVADPSRASYGTSSLLDSGKKFLSLVFGGNQSSIVDAVGRTTGLRSGVVSSLMSMAAPLMMTALGRLVRNDHMNPAGLSKLLVHEGEGVRDLLPAGAAVAEHPP
jgi:hypothetical protein